MDGTTVPPLGLLVTGRGADSLHLLCEVICEDHDLKLSAEAIKAFVRRVFNEKPDTTIPLFPTLPVFFNRTWDEDGLPIWEMLDLTHPYLGPDAVSAQTLAYEEIEPCPTVSTARSAYNDSAWIKILVDKYHGALV